MKCIEVKTESYVFELASREKEVLVDLLSLFPLAHQRKPRLSRSAKESESGEAQKLLEESITAKKRENQKLLISLLGRKERFTENGENFRVALKRGELEWLLQALNDIRVGAWVALGSPDLERPRDIEINPQNSSWAWAMDLAGFFEMSVLQALNPAE
jgi:hypothetical protein